MSKSIEMMGRAGETIIVNYCTAAGQKVTLSEDQYDSQKDMIIDGLKVEVKTQVPYIYKNAFSFKPNQLRKCKNADRVIFISVPSKEKPHHSDGKVYLIKSAEMKHSSYKTKDGRDMIAVPIDQESMDELFTLSKKQCILLQSYSVSAWN
jgi:hypothetical protein